MASMTPQSAMGRGKGFFKEQPTSTKNTHGGFNLQTPKGGGDQTETNKSSSGKNFGFEP
jgi:hypothetical protein